MRRRSRSRAPGPPRRDPPPGRGGGRAPRGARRLRGDAQGPRRLARPARAALPARRGGGVQRGQERVHQRAPRRARPRGGGDADHLAGGDPRARRRGRRGGRRPDGVEETTAPAEILRTVAIVDTPGTNAVLREHEALTRDFLPRADLVLFVTSADRPYTESERAFLEAIREWGKKVVLVLNKADLLETAGGRGDGRRLRAGAGARRRSAPSPRCSRSRPARRSGPASAGTPGSSRGAACPPSRRRSPPPSTSGSGSGSSS